MIVSATDMSMATQISQSSAASWLAATLPATRTVTTSSARAGKKKLMKRAKIWSPDVAGNVGRSNNEEASMTQDGVLLCHYQRLCICDVGTTSIRSKVSDAKKWNRNAVDKRGSESTTATSRGNIHQDIENSRLQT